MGGAFQWIAMYRLLADAEAQIDRTITAIQQGDFDDDSRYAAFTAQLAARSSVD